MGRAAAVQCVCCPCCRASALKPQALLWAHTQGLWDHTRGFQSCQALVQVNHPTDPNTLNLFSWSSIAVLPACLPVRLPACLPAPPRLPACLPACRKPWTGRRVSLLTLSRSGVRTPWTRHPHTGPGVQWICQGEVTH